MVNKNVGKLLWESIEERLPHIGRHEARLLVGADLIEQTLELKSEIDQFVALSSESLKCAPQVSSLLDRISGEKRISEDEISLFLKLFQRETCSSDKSERVFDTPPGGQECTSDIHDLVNQIRKCLKEETADLEDCLKSLQEIFLNNFASNYETPAGDCKRPGATVRPTDTIEQIDQTCQVKKWGENNELPTQPTVKIRGLSKERRRTPVVSSSGSSLSATSSASVSPRTPPEIKPCGRNSPQLIDSLVNQSSKTLHLKNSERLSPSSKALYASIKTSGAYKPGTLLNGHAQVDSKPSVTLPPLNPSNHAGITRTSSCGQSSPTVQPDRPINATRCRPAADLGRFNSAQRFRQMVLQARQHRTESTPSLDFEDK